MEKLATSTYNQLQVVVTGYMSMEKLATSTYNQLQVVVTGYMSMEKLATSTYDNWLHFNGILSKKLLATAWYSQPITTHKSI